MIKEILASGRLVLKVDEEEHAALSKDATIVEDWLYVRLDLKWGRDYFPKEYEFMSGDPAEYRRPWAGAIPDDMNYANVSYIWRATVFQAGGLRFTSELPLY